MAGVAGTTGTTGATGAAGPGGAGGTDGGTGPIGPGGASGAVGARGFSAWDPIPAGTTVTGPFLFDGPGGSDIGHTIMLPGSATTALADTTINFSAAASAFIGDPDASCLGSAPAPTAPTGKVCLYLSGTQNVGAATLVGYATPSLKKAAFVIGWTAAAGETQVWGTWAYTA